MSTKLQKKLLRAEMSLVASDRRLPWHPKFQRQNFTNKGPRPQRALFSPSLHFSSIHLRATTKPGFVNDINIT